jgi:DNA gyrase/topoisomerase IV subunit A
VVDLVYASETPEDAEERVRDLFGVAESHISQAVLDMQIYRWTRSEREKLHARADELRRLLAP